MKIAGPIVTQITTLTHDGKALVFGTTDGGKIVYSVKRSGFEDSALRPGAEPFAFEDWKALRLGESATDASVMASDRDNFTDAGGAVLLRSVYGGATEVTATIDAPVQVVSALGHVCVFRQSPTGKILVSRFVLDGMANELVPRLEVRFRRSGQRLAADPSATARGGASFDNLDYRNIDGKSFFEPALELGFAGPVVNGWFAPLFLPTFESDRFRWHIFAFDAKSQRLLLHTVGASRTAFFDLKDHLYGMQDPDDAENTIYRTIPGITRRTLDLTGLAIAGCPSVVSYDLQREQMTSQGARLTRDAVRVMLAVPVKAAGNDTIKTAVLSFGLARDGSLSQVDLSPDTSTILKSQVREVTTPLSLLDGIKEIGTTVPPPAGTIVATERGAGDLLQIRTGEALPAALKRSMQVRVTGTKSYDGYYRVIAADGDGFQIAATFTNNEAGRFEVVPAVQTGLTFDNMVAGAARTPDGKLLVQSAAHDLKVGDAVQISGTQAYNGVFAAKVIDADNHAFTLDVPYQPGVAANLTKVVRRGLRMASGDRLETPDLELQAPDPERDIGRTLSAWVRPDAPGGGLEQNLIRDGGGLLALALDGDGKPRIQARLSDGSVRAAASEKPLPAGVWTHLSGSIDYRTAVGGDTRIALCRDGAEIAAQTVRHGLPCHLGNQLLDFDGADDGVETTGNPPNVAGRSFSVELWIRRGRSGVQEFAFWQGAAEGALNAGLHIGFRGNDVFTFATWGNDLNTAGTYADGDWHHYACTFNHITRTKRAYRDGVLIGELVCDAVYSGTGVPSIGRFYGGSWPFKGNVADVRFWERVREPEEIAADMSRRLTGRETGLLAYWPLDNGTTRDLTMGKRHGVLKGNPVWTAGSYLFPQGVFGGANPALAGYASFDGVKDLIEIKDLATPTAALTVSAWARSANPTWNQFGCIVSKRDSFMIHPWLGERKVDLTFVINGASTTVSYTPADIQKWHHYAGTFDGTTMRFYVDGALVGQQAAPGQIAEDAGGSLCIGHDDSYGALDRNLAGDVAGVEMWSRALGQAEIQQGMKQRRDGTESGLWGYWPLDMGCTDLSPGRHHGQIWGAPRIVNTAGYTLGGTFAGEMASAQIWERARDAGEVRDAMNLTLTGKEPGLVACYRMGAVSSETQPPIVPDFSVFGSHAVVYGDPYAGARRLNRATAGGLKAIKLGSSELCPVTAHAMYEESLEFRVISPDPAFDPANADGAGRKLFTFSYWGKSSLGSKDVLPFTSGSVQQSDFQKLNDGWYKATCRVVVPDDVNLMRAFELGDVRGCWGAEAAPPANEWTALEVRRHHIRLISDAITRETYTDAAALAVATMQSPALPGALVDLGRAEWKVGKGEQLVADLVARLDVAQNATRYSAEKTALGTKLTTLQTQRTTLQTERTTLVNDPNSYYCKLRAKHSGLVLAASGGNLVQTVEANLDSELFLFRPAKNDPAYYIAIVNKSLPTAVLWAAGAFAEDAASSATSWFWLAVDATYVRIVNTTGNGTLTILNASKASGAGTTCVLWNGVDHQQFTRERSGEMVAAAKDTLAGKDAALAALDPQINAIQARIDYLTLALSGGDTVAALQTQITAAQTSLTAARTEATTKSTTAMAALAPAAPIALSRLATDDRDLVTTGVVLDFVSPQGRVGLLESAEGNVLLTHVDAQGRLRATPFDVALDSRNATFEQWLPDGARACADLRDATDKIALAQPLTLPATGWTCEAWIQYPLATKADGTANSANAVAAAESRADAPLVVVRGNRLGVMADGWFFDAGIDLARTLGIGWHHVAATMGPGGITFYADGVRIGTATSTFQPALRLNGTTDWIEVPAHANPTTALTVSVWARSTGATWNKAANLVAKRDAFVIHPTQNSRDVIFYGFIGGAWKAVTVTMPEIQGWHLYTGTYDGTTMLFFVDGELRGQLAVAGTLGADTGVLIIGSDDAVASATNGPLLGDIAEVAVWSTARSTEDIRQDLYRPLKGDEAGLTGYWRLAQVLDGGVAKVKDLTTNLRHGIVKGAPKDVSPSAQRAIDVKQLGNLGTGGSPIGRLAEVRLWSACLLPDEIAASARALLSGNEPGLLGYFPLGEGSGTTATNRSTDAQIHGTMTGVDWVGCTAPIGSPGAQVLSLSDRGSGYVSGTGIALAGKSFTVECWARRSGGNMGVYVAMVSAGNVNVLNQLLWLGFTNANKPFFGFDGNDVEAAVVITDTDWHHFCGTYDQPSKKQRIYIDGALASERTAPADFTGAATFSIGRAETFATSFFSGHVAEVRIWDRARTDVEIRGAMKKRATGAETGLLSCYPLDEVTSDRKVREKKAGQLQGTLQGSAQIVLTTGLAMTGADSVVATEYSAVDVGDGGGKQAVMRRALGYVTGGAAQILAEQRVEQLTLQWVGNTQINPTLLGYIEGPPPVPGENMTQEEDYDDATSITLAQSEETTYSWHRSEATNMAFNMEGFVGFGWEVEGGFGVQAKMTEGKVGVTGQYGRSQSDQKDTTVTATSSLATSDRLAITGIPEKEPSFPVLGTRWIPKNVGYALVVSGMADVFVTRLKRSGRMVSYDIRPVEGVPLDVNTITFMLNPAYTLLGSLDGMIGSSPADPLFYRHVPAMRAQYGSLYPASYFRVREAYALKEAIERQDKERESFFYNFNAADLPPLDAPASNLPAVSSGGDGKAAPAQSDAQTQQAQSEADKRQSDISTKNGDLKNRMRALSAFAQWQVQMNDIQTRAGKRNVVNTYVWDGDGGLRAEQQSFASTVEHSISTETSESGGIGFSAETMLFGLCLDLSLMASAATNSATSKTLGLSRSLQLDVDLSGVEKDFITDLNDNPRLPGEKVDRYRFMTFYLEGSTDHFNDFFRYVVDPVWLAGNDEEARALRQARGARPNKTWRVLHRVTYVERPALQNGVGDGARSLNTAHVTTPNPLARQAELVDRLETIEDKVDDILLKVNEQP